MKNELKKSSSRAVDNPNLSYNVVDVSNFKNVKETVDEISKDNQISIF